MRPAVPVGMGLLLGHLQALAHEVEVVDVGEPHPRGGALRARRRSAAVPLRQLSSIRSESATSRLRECLVEVGVHRVALVSATGVVAPAAASS